MRIAPGRCDVATGSFAASPVLHRRGLNARCRPSTGHSPTCPWRRCTFAGPGSRRMVWGGAVDRFSWMRCWSIPACTSKANRCR